MQFKDKIVIVTGGAQGIGKCISDEFRKEGAHVCSDKAGFITGENICIDGGMTKQMIYHAEHGWTLNK